MFSAFHVHFIRAFSESVSIVKLSFCTILNIFDRLLERVAPFLCQFVTKLRELETSRSIEAIAQCYCLIEPASVPEWDCQCALWFMWKPLPVHKPPSFWDMPVLYLSYDHVRHIFWTFVISLSYPCHSQTQKRYACHILILKKIWKNSKKMW